MNKSRGNMDIWVDATHNALAGRCVSCCSFCYMSKMNQPAVIAKYSGSPRLHKPAMKESLGEYNVIFASDCADLFAGAVPTGVIERILKHYSNSPTNWYHFRSKFPANFCHGWQFPPKTILGTSIETTHSTSMWDSGISHAPVPWLRAAAMYGDVGDALKMVALEPLFKFDLMQMLEWIEQINPHFVTVGIDSKDTPHPIGEPTAEEIMSLVWKLQRTCDVILKPNLVRILKDEFDNLSDYLYYHNSDLFRTHATYSQDAGGIHTLAGMCGYEYLEGLHESEAGETNR